MAPNEIVNRIRRRLRSLYGEDVDAMCERLFAVIGRYGVGLHPKSPNTLWSEKDTVLITYGDMVSARGEAPLRTLRNFCTKHLKGAVSTIHILPFYPWSSDDGFSVRDYRRVDSALGDWSDIRSLSSEFDLMFDLVLNHCSAKGEWFRDFVAGIQPASEYFITGDPRMDNSQVVRPRTSPLLTPFATRDGEKWVWTTFSADQVDLNWKNPDLLFEFIDILMGYLSQGVRILRLDAVAFLWKEEGTSCIHLPETHEIVRLFRDLLEWVAPETILLTETNVPHKENISYFGEGEEAHMVYQFALPPLLLHGLLRGTSEYLNKWAASLPDLPHNQSYLNFTASHDGIGVRSLTGLLPPAEVKKVLATVREKGGLISSKSNPDGTTGPYEMNITYPSALSEPENPKLGWRRYLCSQAVMLALKGIPAVYFNSLFGSENDTVGVGKSGHNRSINRKKWNTEALDAELQSSDAARFVFPFYLHMLRKRAAFPVFHPNAGQRVHLLRDDIFIIERTAVSGEQTLLCLFNFRPVALTFRDFSHIPSCNGVEKFQDILTGKTLKPMKRGIQFSPYQAFWLLLK